MSWDGKFLDVQLPNGSYVYRIFGENGEIRKNGTISIIR
jgi:hypothetical protein